VRISVVKDFSPSRLMPQMIAEAIAQHAVRDPHWPAIVGTQFAPFSFRGLDLWIKQIGEHLRAAGIGPPSHIGIMLPPGPEGAVLSVAIACHAIQSAPGRAASGGRSGVAIVSSVGRGLSSGEVLARPICAPG
jgi:acyl-CoA synthetase (AMP-forming)/AMP-acid ligase II